jgi:hypothetical protein
VKNFLFYAGNARAGSTWLYGELNVRGDCDFGKIKEKYFFHDGIDLSRDFDKSRYYEYHSSLAEPECIKLVGDMTPCNAYASRNELISYNEELSNRGFNVLPLMTLRDPLTQIMSETLMFRNVDPLGMYQQNDKTLEQLGEQLTTIIMNGRYENHVVSVDDIMKHAATPLPWTPCSWSETIENCNAVFGKIKINFYEKLFTEDCLKDITDYLEIPYQQFNYQQKVFSLGKLVELTEDDKQTVYENYPFYKENYAFAVEKFGKEFIENIWWTPYK